MVREAVGLAAYAAGDWTTAIAELRTYHRMTGRQTHLAELADCERALGRPERAIDLFRGADRETLDKAGAIELLIVAAGARGDLGQHDAAVAMLQVKELTSEDDAEWAARLRYAYADALLAAGRRDEAREWFSRAAAVDEDDLTDAAERLLELDGVTIEGDDDEDEDGPAGAAQSGADLDDEDDDADVDGEDQDDEDDAAYRREAFLDDDVDHGDDDEDDEDRDELGADGLDDEDEDRDELRDRLDDDDEPADDEPADGEDIDVDAGIDAAEDGKGGGDEFTAGLPDDGDDETGEDDDREPRAMGDQA